MTGRRWPRTYCCHICKRNAAIRVFTCANASYGGGGWPICQAHAQTEIHRLLRLIVDNPTWTMTVFAVEADEDNWPRMRRVIFTARAKPTALQGATPHATAPS